MKKILKEEKALEDAERRYRSIFQSAPEVMAIADMKGVVTDVNEAAVLLSGYTRDELVGKHFTKIPVFNARDIPRYVKVFGSLIRGKTPEPFEISLTTKDGKTLYAEVHLGIIESGGEKLGIYAFFRSITDRKRAEEELSVSDARFRSLAENAADILLTIDLDGRFTYFSKDYDEETGFTAEELIGRSIGDILTLQSKLKAFRRLARWINGEREFSPMMLWVETKKGETLPFEINDSPIIEDGKLKGIIVVARNVEERYMMEERNRRSEERLKILFENAPDAIFLGDYKGTIIDGNKTAERMLGYTRDELKGKTMLSVDLLPLDQIPKFSRSMARSALGQPTGPEEFVIKRKDGERINVEVSTYPVKIEDRSLALGIARDITRRKKIEGALKDSEDQFKNWIEVVPVVVMNVDLAGMVTYVNKAFEEGSGYNREEVIGRPAAELGLVSDEVVEFLLKRMAERLDGAPSERHEALFRGINGQERWIELQSILLTDESGSPTGFQIIGIDITERVEYREMLESLVNEFSKVERVKGVDKKLPIGIA